MLVALHRRNGNKTFAQPHAPPLHCEVGVFVVASTNVAEAVPLRAPAFEPNAFVDATHFESRRNPNIFSGHEETTPTFIQIS
jgi:hypothetical protein